MVKHTFARRKCNTSIFGVGLLLISIVILIFILSITFNYDIHVTTITRTDRPMYTVSSHSTDLPLFTTVHRKGVFSYKDVCIENRNNLDNDTLFFITRNITYNTTLSITIYNSPLNMEFNRFMVGASYNMPPEKASWKIHFRKVQPPSSHKILNHIGYFINPTCPGNLHHFWEDEMVMLYTVMNKTGQLVPDAKNQIIYRHPSNLEPSEASCYDTRTYEGFLKTLKLKRHAWYGSLEPNICFRYGVFGLANLLNKNESPRVAVEYVLKQYHLDRNSCHEHTVTIVQRRKRRILQIENLKLVLLKSGYKNVNIVQFENMTLSEQMKAAACSKILIGVQGAGLQWAIFMPKKSMLVEIAWPKTFWPHYFRSLAETYNFNYLPIDAYTVRPNWQAYESEVRAGVPVQDENKATLVNSVPRSVTQDNIWKWADVTVDADALVDKLNNSVHR